MLIRVVIVVLALALAAVTGLVGTGKLDLHSVSFAQIFQRLSDPHVSDPRVSRSPETAPVDEATSPPAAASTNKGLDTIGKDLAAIEAPARKPPAPDGVTVDISRIAKDGVSVFAGAARPNAYVTLLDGDTTVGTTQADANGEWTLTTEHAFATLEPKLTFKVTDAPPETAPRPDAVVAVTQPGSSPSASPADPLQKFERLVADARRDAAGAPALAGTEQRADAASNAPTTSTPRTSTSTAPDQPGTEVSIPVPITFVYNDTTLTPDGRHAASLLLEYVKLKRLTSLSLTGHADERGSDAFNDELSRERLTVVAKLLRDGGYDGALELVAKGKREPYRGVDRSTLTAETLYQLDRRVELRFTR